MRDVTVQYKEPQIPVVQVARWAGVALIFYAAALAIDNSEIYTRPNGSVWTLLILVLPYLILAAVLFFSADFFQATDSRGPIWIAGALLVVYAAITIDAYLEPGIIGLGGGNENGTWRALRPIVSDGLPLLFLLPLLTATGRLARLMPSVALAVAALVLTAGIAIALHDLDFQRQFGQNPSVWWKLSYLIPAGTYGFILLIAALRCMNTPWLRPISFIVIITLAVSALAYIGLILDRAPLSVAWWQIGISETIRWSRILAIAVFAALLTRPQVYALTSTCALALLISQIAYVDHFAGDLQGLGMFWLISLNIIQVGSMLLLALVITEATALQPRTAPARRYARIA